MRNIKSTIFSLLSNGFSYLLIKICGVLLGIYIARQFGIESYGVYSGVIATVVLFGNTLGNSISSIIPSKFETLDISFGNASISVVLSVFIMLAVMLILGMDLVEIVLAICAIIGSASIGVLNSLGLSKKLNLFSTVAMLSFALAFFIFQCFNLPASVYIYLYGVPFAVVMMLSLIYIVPELGLFCVEVKGVAQYLRRFILLYSSSLFAPLGLYYVYSKLQEYQTSSEVGIFASCMQWGIVLSQLAVVANNVLIKKIAYNNNKDAMLSDFNALLTLLPVVIFSSLLFIFPQIHSLIFGGEFKVQEYSFVLNLILLSMIVNSFKSSIQRNIIANDRYYMTVASGGLWIFILFVLINAVTPTLNNLVICYTLSLIFSTLIMLPFFLKSGVLDVSFYWDRRFIVFVVSVIATFTPKFLGQSIFYQIALYLLSLLFLMLVCYFSYFRRMIASENR